MLNFSHPYGSGSPRLQRNCPPRSGPPPLRTSCFGAPNRHRRCTTFVFHAVLLSSRRFVPVRASRFFSCHPFCRIEPVRPRPCIIVSLNPRFCQYPSPNGDGYVSSERFFFFSPPTCVGLLFPSDTITCSLLEPPPSDRLAHSWLPLRSKSCSFEIIMLGSPICSFPDTFF